MTGPAALLSIGELAAASGLSAKALRMYDASGLLAPRAVDPYTGYRSYGRDQVGRARLIAALRGVGMPLARIAVVCDLSPADARGEIRSWWRQEEADLVSRRASVDDVLRSLDAPGDASGGLSHPTKEHVMNQNSIPARTRVETALRVDVGRERPRQQDAALARALPGGRTVIAVADGFGEDDARAATTLQAFADGLETALGDECCCPTVTDALETAWSRAEELISGDGGTTLTAAVIDGQRLHVAHIGDGRALLARDGSLEVITQDHTRLRSLVAAGRLSPEEATTHPDRRILNRALAADAPSAPDLLGRRVAAGDRIVLVTDGVHAVVDPAIVAGAATRAASVEETAERLLQAALEAGGPDNVAVAVADIARP